MDWSDLPLPPWALVALALAVLAFAIPLIVALRRRKLRVKEIEVSLPPLVKAKIEPTSKKEETPAPTPTPPASPSSVEISGNVMLGSPIIRVWRSGVRVVRNWLAGNPTIDVRETPPVSPPRKGQRQ